MFPGQPGNGAREGSEAAIGGVKKGSNGFAKLTLRNLGRAVHGNVDRFSRRTSRCFISRDCGGPVLRSSCGGTSVT